MANERPIEFIFLGTGTSASIPHVDCLTSPPDGRKCVTCLSTLKPEGKKNMRRNTSAVIRMAAPSNGKDVTIVIDAGKTFQAAALEWFPKYGLRRIDALLLTHPHADAMNGLDDLRGWTLGKKIQDHIDVYLTAFTFTEVQRCFPYLVDKGFASGGGDVPEFKWHIITETEEFQIGDTGIAVMPFAVQHGRIFTPLPCPSMGSTPATVPSTPTIPMSQMNLKEHNIRVQAKKDEVIHPYFCLGFKIQKDIVYISDTSLIPEDVWELILPPKDQSIPLFIIDTLHLRPFISHLGIGGAIEAVRRMRATRSYLIGFSHEVTHDEWTRITEVVTAGKPLGQDAWLDNMTACEKEGVSLVMDDNKENTPAWVRPAFDGLRVWINPDQTVRDDFY
ncbi:hypothetical protein BDZ89DRAFT_1069893 [Hymenopellis radicata]|nr:hypothetical protein BDZ89DRAFT_1069893 [Hymenopellis radicata]